MASIDQLKGSDGTGPAALMTIQTLRAALSSTIVVDTVVGVPANFIGTMGTPDTGTGIITDASAVDFRGHVNGANLEIDAISPGFTDIGSAVGDVVVIKPTTDWADKAVQALRVSHNDDGSIHATRPQVVTSIDDTNGNEVIKTPATASAVNEITVTNAATGNAPAISATGGDTDINMTLTPKGTGYVKLDYTGAPVQGVSVGYSAVATGTTIIPQDDTIPQKTEGDEYMSLAITPKSATNILVIEVSAYLSSANATQVMTCALFQDTTTDAIAASASFTDASTVVPKPVVFTHRMVAGTTSATTFKVRAGSHQASTTTFNGVGGNRRYGAIPKSSITITEYKA